jgi:hypothetical protein
MATDPCVPTLPPAFGSGDALCSGPQHAPSIPSHALSQSSAGGFSCHSVTLRVSVVTTSPQSAFTALAIRLVVLAVAHLSVQGQSKQSVVVHQGGDAALSCRLCLIACNSRQFDEVDGLVDESEPGRDR